MEVEGSVFSTALEGLAKVRSEEGKILTKPFLDICNSLLPVIDKFGGAFSFVKSDIGGNILRLQSKYESDPSEYKLLFTVVQKEVEAKKEKVSSSCTNSLLWLSRSMDFTVQMFSNLREHEDWSMRRACADSYNKTLKPWHGWLASSSFGVAIKLLPDRKKFMEIISGTGDFDSDMEKFCTGFSSVLAENHQYLASVGMNDMKA
ncbi:glycolipid transfer protein 1-like [Gastrolobium bilobum]|uniref:glycolipid transfer protein 1-like n=1 Tax=Gastrolobium bilobum TaxID=150636 RepID=UPI002AB0856B|nr:glycolipid transfer protein 1-like [Gastrolobium bilobum]